MYISKRLNLLLVFFLCLTANITLAATEPYDSAYSPTTTTAGSNLVAPANPTNVVITRPFSYILARGTGTFYVGKGSSNIFNLNSLNAINTLPTFTSYTPTFITPDPNNPVSNKVLLGRQLNSNWTAATTIYSQQSDRAYSFLPENSTHVVTPISSTCPSNLVMVPKITITAVNIAFYAMCYTSAFVNFDFTNDPNKGNAFPLTLIPAYVYQSGYNNGYPSGDLDVTFCYKSTDPTISYVQTFPHSNYNASAGTVDVAMRNLPAAAKAKIVLNVIPDFQRLTVQNVTANYLILRAPDTTTPVASITFAQPSWVSILRITGGSYADNRYNHNEAEKAYNNIRYFQFVVKADFEWKVTCEPR